MPGAAEVELYRTETDLLSRQSGVRRAGTLGRDDSRPKAIRPIELVTVTADPAEGEGFTESARQSGRTGGDAGIDPEIVAAFVAEHHVERQFFKRKRDRQDTESLARRGYGDHDD